MLDNKQRAHELALLYMDGYMREVGPAKVIAGKFIDFTTTYADAYLYIYERLQSDSGID